MGMIEFVTTHFNPNKSKRVKETWFEWFDTLPSHVQHNLKTYELILPTEESEIPNSIKLLSPPGVMWRKEIILNYALQDVDCLDTPFFCILDHDMVFNTDDWFIKGMEKIFDGHAAVQLMKHITFEDPNREKCFGSSTATLIGPKHSNPGGPWMVNTEFLKNINGFFPYCLAGNGDVYFFQGVCKPEHFRGWYDEKYPLHKYANWYVERVRTVLQEMNLEWATYLDCKVRHLYHGALDNRQYLTRGLIALDHKFDPGLHLTSNVLGEFSDQCPKEFINELKLYFKNRKEDSHEGYRKREINLNDSSSIRSIK